MARIKSITIIQDPLLEPYYVSADKECFTVLERTFSDPTHRLSKGESKEGFKIMGYYTKFEDCLNKIAKLQLLETEQYSAVQDFLEEYNKISDKIKKYTENVRSNL